MTEPYALRKAQEIAATAWAKWDTDMQQLCVCGHTAANHLGDGCRVVLSHGMCTCSVYEAPRAEPSGPASSDYDYLE